MSNRFDIVISAVDRASKPMANINKSLEKMMRPIERLNRSFSNLGKEMHFDKMMKGYAKFGSNLRSFGITSPLVTAAAGGMGLAEIIGAMNRLVANAGSYGRTIARLSQRTGAGSKALQRYRGAAQLMGLPSEAMDQGFTNLSDVARNAQFDPNTAMLLAKLGVRVKRGKDGLPDLADLMQQMAASAQVQKNPDTAKAVLDQLGLGDLFPLLRDGAKNLEDLARKAEKFGVVLDDGAIKTLTDFDRSMIELKTHFEILGRSVALDLVPAIKSGVDWINDRFKPEAKGSKEDKTSMLESSANPLSWLANAFQFGEALGTPGWVAPTAGDKPDAPATNGGAKLPLGIRNNNPGNLRNSGGSGFQRFSTMMEGYRAMGRQLSLYYNRDGLDTINGVVSKWAPPSENNTSAYIQSVARQTGFKPDQHLNLNDPATMESFIRAMVTQEGNGKALTEAGIGKAVADALRHTPLKLAPQGASGGVALAMPSDGTR